MPKNGGTALIDQIDLLLDELKAGDLSSKRSAADWAKVNLYPSWVPLIDRTWGGRPNPAQSIRRLADPGDFKSTLKFVGYSIEVSRKYAANTPGIKEE